MSNIKTQYQIKYLYLDSNAELAMPINHKLAIFHIHNKIFIVSTLQLKNRYLIILFND